MQETVEFLKEGFDLPNHENELSKANEAIEKLKININNKIKTVDLISDIEFISLYEEIIRVLDYVGRLSKVVFDIQDRLEDDYILKYKSSPELAKKLWIDHCEKLHHPYNLLKNRCFKLLDDIDNYYQALYDKFPPNWNI